MNKVIVITGPTGVGKTSISVCLAKKLDGEIINADAMQVYKGLDIGTAKIMEEEKNDILHYLFDICDYDDDYNIFRYQADSRRVINEILKKGKTPILVGGSGLYIKSALYDYRFQEERIKENYDELNNLEIKEEILKHYEIDIHVNNRKRLIRELNKIKNNNRVVINKNQPMYDIILIGLTTSREKLYDIINKRVDQMIKKGLIEEVKALYDKKVNTKAINTGIGYKELYKYFNGELTLNESIELIKKNSRHFAKRQYTFIRNQFSSIKWFEVNFNDLNKTINEVYSYIKNFDA